MSGKELNFSMSSKREVNISDMKRKVSIAPKGNKSTFESFFMASSFQISMASTVSYSTILTLHSV